MQLESTTGGFRSVEKGGVVRMVTLKDGLRRKLRSIAAQLNDESFSSKNFFAVVDDGDDMVDRSDDADGCFFRSGFGSTLEK